MKGTTAAALRKKIDRILKTRAEKAAQSEYDISVCVRAVRAASDAVDSIPVHGDVRLYHRAVLQALSRLSETYNDSSGEYTNGRAAIGDVHLDIMALAQSED